MKILKLKEKGRKTLGISSGESDRLGGAEHRYCCKMLAERLKAKGYEVAEEFPIGGGKTIDLVATRDGKRIAFEIETGKSDAAANVRKCLAAGMDKVVVVATCKMASQKIGAEVMNHSKVKLLTTRDLLR
ncbi:MAG: hypothetical protein KAV00_05430 [Phycisphaerae bacterium]|nr:hypothetical protein [Phycisphaerae bacterium]